MQLTKPFRAREAGLMRKYFTSLKKTKYQL